MDELSTLDAKFAIVVAIVAILFVIIYFLFENTTESELEREDAEIIAQAKIWLDGFNEIVKARNKDKAEGTVDEAVKTTLSKLAVKHKIEKIK